MFKKNTGFLPNPFDPRDIWEDEILAGDEPAVELPKSYRIEGLEYERQGTYPFCVSFATIGMVEYLYKKKGINYNLSQPHLFFNSGGTDKGSWFRANLKTAVSPGCISHAKMPMPSVTYARPNGWYDKMREEALAIPFDDAKKIGAFIRINGNSHHRTKQAILKYGPLLIGVGTGNNWFKGGKRSRIHDNHAIRLVGWNEDGTWVGFDSLMYFSGDNGYRTIHKDFGFTSVYAITELEKKVIKAVQKNRDKGFKHCLNHYGQPRNFSAEQRVAAQLTEEFEKFSNQSVLEAAGKFWTVYINAVVYGGYSISYKKFGLWQPGDILNDCYNWRRTGEHIFDFNKLRSEHEG